MCHSLWGFIKYVLLVLLPASTHTPVIAVAADLFLLYHVCVLQELDEQLYEECRQRYEQEQQQNRQKEAQRQQEWQLMQQQAEKVAAVKGLPNCVADINSTYQPILIRSKS